MVVHKGFENFIYVIIFLNCLLMTIKWPKMSLSIYTTDIIESINYVFTGIFVLEVAVKLIAYSSRYFRDSWNIFDFFIVVTSLVFITLNGLFELNIGTTMQVVRTLKLGRIWKLFRSMKQLQIIFSTMITTLSSLINVGALIGLCIYIYMVIGITLFADVK